MKNKPTKVKNKDQIIRSRVDPDHIELGQQNSDKRKNKETREEKKQGVFNSILNKLIILPNLKLLNLSISFLKGFDVKVEFFEEKGKS